MTKDPTWLGNKPIDKNYLIEMRHHIKIKADSKAEAHAAFIEHATFVDALMSIAIGVPDPKGLALEALKSLDIPFDRTAAPVKKG